MSDVVNARVAPLSIAAAERDTGLSKDILRIWERRYGFPQPDRDAAGERLYAVEQIEKLRLIKRLMDRGHRPGRMVALPLDELRGLLGNSGDDDASAPDTGSADVEACLQSVRAHDVDGLRRRLGQALLHVGLGRFVIEWVIPLNTRIGDAWMRGQLEVFEEHLCTEAIQVVMRNALYPLSHGDGARRPSVLLTTFPGEPHALGLLMAEALLAVGGCRCISLGVQTPVWDIVRAAVACEIDIVALSFTGVANPNQITDGLAELRRKLPESVAVWAGGSAPVLHRRPVPGVLALASLEQIAPALQQWREHRA